jgi:quinol monooxygenase YgiN
MYQLIRLWRSANLTQISYEAYDSTLRILNQTKFKGFEEWKDILVVNEYLSSCHMQYVKDTSYMIYLAQKHNTILDRMKMISPEVVQAE